MTHLETRFQGHDGLEPAVVTLGALQSPLRIKLAMIPIALQPMPLPVPGAIRAQRHFVEQRHAFHAKC